MPAPAISAKFKLMANTLEQNFLTWHFGKGLSLFLESRKEHLEIAFATFNFKDLLKNLFTPYKRMVAKPKTKLTDRISYNLISTFIGFFVRLIFITIGTLAIIFVALYNILSLIIYIVLPVFSLLSYINYKNSHLFEEDIQDPTKFHRKLTNSSLFTNLSLFFDENFKDLFTNLPQPATLKITPNQEINAAFLNIVKNWPYLAKYLEQISLKPKDFDTLVNFLIENDKNPPVAKHRPLGQSLIFGYTNTLEKFGSELSFQKISLTNIRKETLDQIEKTILRPQNNNVLLVGSPGVGRHTTLEDLASKIQKELIPSLSGKRVFLLDTIALLGSSKSLIEVKKSFEDVLKEAKSAGNIILAIDQIDRIVSPIDQRVDLSQVLSTVLSGNDLPIIGISTPQNFNRFIRPNANLFKLFEKIDLNEPKREETMQVLFAKSLDFYHQEKIKTTLSAIIEIVDKSSRLVSDRNQPEKSILLLIDSIAEAKDRKQSKITTVLVDEILAKKTKTPIGNITENEAQKLKDLETILHQRIIGQNEAIEAIAKAMRRSRAEIETGTRPIGSFLFLGPTGVGKTETAKALAQSYFGSEDRMIRLDMSEFSTPDSIKRLIGNTASQTPGRLATAIRDNPYSLLLIDEFEKASPPIHNLFLQILDEGFLTDAFGKKVSFDNIIIIATSNAGAEFIREQISSGSGSNLSKKLVDHVLEKGLFRPELVNRFDGVIVYQPLTQDQVVKVTLLMLKDLAKQLKDTKNINIEITNELANAVAQQGFNPTFGARPIRRLISNKIEDGIAKLVISGEAKSGTTIPAQTLLRFVS